VPAQDFSKLFAPIMRPDSLGFSDPYVLYDDQVDRFYVGIIELFIDPFTGAFLADLDLAVSNSGSPEIDGWMAPREITTVEEGGNYFADFPKMGWNHDAVFVSFNQFDAFAGFFDHNLIVNINKNALLSNDKLIQDQNYFQVDVDTGLDHNILIPARMHGTKLGDPEYLVQTGFDFNGIIDAVNVVKMTDILTSTPTFQSTDITVHRFTDTPGVPELTFQIDDRMLSADWVNNKLVAAQDIGFFTDTFNNVRGNEL